MKKAIFALSFSAAFGCPAHAQFIVSDLGVEATTATIAAETATIATETATIATETATIATQTATIATEAQAANTELAAIARATQATATTTAETLTMMTTPTVIIGQLNMMDGGATANSPVEAAEFMPALGGTTSVSPLATGLLTQERADLIVDEQQGRITGNSEDAQAQRQLRTGTNIQGLAYRDSQIYGTRFVSAEALAAKLSAVLDIKGAVVWTGALMLEVLRTLNLLGQSISLTTAAVAEARLQHVNETVRLKDDHQQTAIQFATTP